MQQLLTKGIGHKEFKNTEIGRIPKDWRIPRLPEIADIIMGQSPPSSTYNEEGNGLPFLQGNAEFGEIHPSSTMYCSDPQKVAEKGDILLSVRAPVGDVNIAQRKYCIGRGLSTIRPEESFLGNIFLFYYLKFSSKIFKQLSLGTTFKAIRRREIQNLRIPLPPLSEQRRIASILSTVDEAIQLVDKAIDKTKRLKRGLMQELLTKGIGHKEFKQTEIGEIPEEWNILGLSEIFNLANGKVKPTRISKAPDDESPHSVFGGNGIIGYSSESLISEPAIVIGRVGECGSIHKAPQFSWVTDNAMYTKEVLRDDVSLDFFAYLLGYMDLNKLKRKSVQPLITQKAIYLTQVPLPPLSEQCKISEILSTIDEKLELEKQRKEKLKKIKKGLMHELLTGRRRVKIDEGGAIERAETG